MKTINNVNRGFKLISLIGACLLFNLYFLNSGFARPTVQNLNKKLSSFSFDLLTPVSSIKGDFKEYSGTLDLDSKDLSNSKVTFKIDLSKIKLRAVNQNSIFNLEPVLQSLPNPITIFKSSKITKEKDGDYKVSGIAKRGQSSYPLTLDMKVLEKNSKQSKFKISLAGRLAGSDTKISPIVDGLLQSSNGKLTANLTFN